MTRESIYSTDIEPLLVTPFPSFILLPSGKIAKGNLAHFDYSTVDMEFLKKQPIADTLFSEIGNDTIESILSATVPQYLQDVAITTKQQTTKLVTLYTIRALESRKNWSRKNEFIGNYRVVSFR